MESLKEQAGISACGFVTDGMVVGLGTGSTVRYTIIELARRIRQEDLEVSGVPTSEDTRQLAEMLEIPLLEIQDAGSLDLTIDGADEFDSNFDLIKGGGGALTREKIVACASRKFVCVMDNSKLVKMLGEFPLPVEVIPMARSLVGRRLVAYGGLPEFREGFESDNGNVVLDVRNLPLSNPHEMEKKINNIPGVVENGIFAERRADVLLISGENGVECIET